MNAQVGAPCRQRPATTFPTVQLRGISVMAGLTGEIDGVLEAFFAGRLPAPECAMQGWSFVPLRSG